MFESRPNLTYAAIGFLIVEPPIPIAAGTESITTLSYHGVDRLPNLIHPDPLIRKDLGLPDVLDERLKEGLEKYFDCIWQETAFFATLEQVQKFICLFKEHGLNYDCVFCHIVCGHEDKSLLDSYKMTMAPPERLGHVLGFDVSWPSANHSAIRQPGVFDKSANWRAKLNSFGLLSDYDDAIRLRKDYLNVYPHPPFDIFLVHQVKT